MNEDSEIILKRKIRIFVATVAFAVAAISIGNFAAGYRQTLKTAERTTAGNARALSEHAESAIAESDLVLNDIIHELSLHETADRIDQQKLYEIITRNSKGAPQIGMVFLVNRDGELFINSSKFPSKKVNVADREYFQFFLQHAEAELYLSNPLFSRLTAQWRFNLVRPLPRRDGRFTGIVAVAFNTSYFRNFFPPESMGRKGKILLIKDNGSPIVNEPGDKAEYEMNFKDSSLLTHHLPATPSGTYSREIEKSVFGDSIISYQRLQRFPVTAVVSMDRNEVLKGWYRHTVPSALMLFALISSAILFVRILFKHLDRLSLSKKTVSYQQHKIESRLKIFESIANGIELPKVLEQIALMIEYEIPGALCSILLADEKGEKLRHGAAPNLPDFYNRAVDGLPIAPRMGSCGTAAFTRKRVVVENINTHPYWKGFSPAREAGLNSCWSEPIITTADELLGTFAIYHKVEKAPAEGDIHLIETASQLCAIVIGRVRQEDAKNKLEAKLLHMQKIDAVGQLAGGIAHDFNNLLTPIIAYSEMLACTFEHDEKNRRKAENILSAAHKAKDLTHQLLSFGRKQNLLIEPHDLNEIVRSFQEIMRRTIKASISITMNLAEPHALVSVDRGQIEQILLNLAINAQDAIQGKGQISIETGHILLDEEYVRLHPGMNSGRHILLAFSDTGSGMSKDLIKHIFEPFFTTKPVGHGTGLGLAMVYGIVKQHGGYINLLSKEGEGTTFIIYLPEFSGTDIVPIRDLPTSASALPDLSTPSHRSILLVEDNDSVREMMAELLKSRGYDVLEAASPLTAIQLAAESGNRIDLLVSDVVMPEMNGMELYEKISESRGGVPVLFVSGYASDAVASDDFRVDEMNFLSKPFATEKFLKRVQMILENSQRSSSET